METVWIIKPYAKNREHWQSVLVFRFAGLGLLLTN
jgi:hypothetical protein